MSNVISRICAYVVFRRNVKTTREVLRARNREDIKSGVLDVRMMPMTLGMHEAGDISFVGLEIGILAISQRTTEAESR